MAAKCRDANKYEKGKKDDIREEREKNQGMCGKGEMGKKIHERFCTPRKKFHKSQQRRTNREETE